MYMYAACYVCVCCRLTRLGELEEGEGEGEGDGRLSLGNSGRSEYIPAPGEGL